MTIDYRLFIILFIGLLKTHCCILQCKERERVCRQSNWAVGFVCTVQGSVIEEQDYSPGA